MTRRLSTVVRKEREIEQLQTALEREEKKADDAMKRADKMMSNASKAATETMKAWGIQSSKVIPNVTEIRKTNIEAEKNRQARVAEAAMFLRNITGPKGRSQGVYYAMTFLIVVVSYFLFTPQTC